MAIWNVAAIAIANSSLKTLDIFQLSSIFRFTKKQMFNITRNHTLSAHSPRTWSFHFSNDALP